LRWWSGEGGGSRDLTAGTQIRSIHIFRSIKVGVSSCTPKYLSSSLLAFLTRHCFRKNEFPNAMPNAPLSERIATTWMW
jgi:hypothetical protein